VRAGCFEWFEIKAADEFPGAINPALLVSGGTIIGSLEGDLDGGRGEMRL
jgi:hypothetical protein